MSNGPKFEITHGARRTDGLSRTERRAARQHGEGEVLGKRHPYLPLLFGRFLGHPEWDWHAAEERGARVAQTFGTFRYWLLMIGLSGLGLLIWTMTDGPWRLLALVIWTSVILSVINS